MTEIFQLYETTTDEEADDTMDNEDEVTQNSSGVVDLEDLGKVMKKMKTAKVRPCVIFLIQS